MVKRDLIFFASLDKQIRKYIISDFEAVDKSESWGLWSKPYKKTLELLHFVDELMARLDFEEVIELVNAVGSNLSEESIFKALVSGKFKGNVDLAMKALKERELVATNLLSGKGIKNLPSQLRKIGMPSKMTSKNSGIYATGYLKLKSEDERVIVMKRDDDSLLLNPSEVRLEKSGLHSQNMECVREDNIVTIRNINRWTFNKIIAEVDYLDSKNIEYLFRMAWSLNNIENEEFYIIIKPQDGLVKPYRIGHRSVYQLLGIVEKEILREARGRSWHATKEEFAPPVYPTVNIVRQKIEQILDEVFFRILEKNKVKNYDFHILKESDRLAYEIIRQEYGRLADAYFLALNELTAKDKIYGSDRVTEGKIKKRR